MRLGVLGSSEGNGHPFSFSAIVNGYDSERLKSAGWDVIADYLDPRDRTDFGLGDVTVSHAWCPDANEARLLCQSSHIANQVSEPNDMVGIVDGVLLARDDWESHWDLASPFLAAGIPVFIDKPLTLDPDELAAFRPYLESGQLMSCSGFRFSPELDVLRQRLTSIALPRVFCGAGPGSWERYAVHLIEPLLSLTSAHPVAVVPLASGHESAAVELSDGSLLFIDCMGATAPGFIVNITAGSQRHEIFLSDRFTAFRRLLGHFVTMVETGQPPIEPADTEAVMRVVMARRASPTPSRRFSVGLAG